MSASKPSTATRDPTGATIRAQRAGRLRLDLGVHLVGLDLEERLAGAHDVAFLFSARHATVPCVMLASRIGRTTGRMTVTSQHEIAHRAHDAGL